MATGWYFLNTPTITKTGSQTFSIYFQDDYGSVANTSLTVNCDFNISKIAITTPPTKTQYEIGEELDTTGMVVTATLGDNSTQIIPEKTDTVNGWYLTSTDHYIHNPGENTFEIAFKDIDNSLFTAELTVSCVTTITSIKITKYPNKMEYEYGERVDPTGMEIEVTYSNGEIVHANQLVV